jgi:hypothetical protein
MVRLAHNLSDTIMGRSSYMEEANFHIAVI